MSSKSSGIEGVTIEVTEPYSESPGSGDSDAPPPSDFLEVTPERLAIDLLREHGDRILVVRARAGHSGWRSGELAGDGSSTAYWLREDGRWTDSAQPWHTALKLALRSLQEEAKRRIDDPATYVAFLRRLYKVKKSMAVWRKSVRMDIDATNQLAPGGSYPRVTVCFADELDADFRYIGCSNGVVDLREGRLLPPSEARRKLVTVSTGVEFDPEAEHPALDQLFAYLSEEERRWWFEAIGYAMHGKPSRRFYMAIGETGGGKTTCRQALSNALGAYATLCSPTVLTAGDDNTHNAFMHGFAAPARLTLLDEAPAIRGRIAVTRLKQMAGDCQFELSMKFQNPRTVTGSATLFWFANPADVPRLRLEDPAMAARIRRLDYPQVPEEEQKGSLRRTIATVEFRKAMLARLVRAAATVDPDNPPADVPQVSKATAEMVIEDKGLLGEVAQRLVETGVGNLHLATVWETLCAEADEPVTAKYVEGVSKRILGRRLRALVPELPAPKPVSVAGKIAQGWYGWQLLEAEVDHA